MFVGSHYPAKVTPEVDMTLNKVVICVRNPIDVITSNFHHYMSWSHSLTVDYKPENPHFKAYWEKEVKFHIRKWTAYHRWWIQKARKNLEQKGFPVLMMRYEDILQNS